MNFAYLEAFSTKRSNHLHRSRVPYGCSQELDDRQTYLVNQEANSLERRSLELLNDMLPKELLVEFQNDNLRLAYSHESLAFLFADICGFTAWSRTVSAEQVLSLLQVSLSLAPFTMFWG